MQFGDPKAILPTVLKTTIVVALICAGVMFSIDVRIAKIVILFLSLEGTGFLAGAFSASAEVPVQGTFFERVKSFFRPKRAVPVHYSPPLFYGGLLLLSISYILSVAI